MNKYLTILLLSLFSSVWAYTQGEVAELLVELDNVQQDEKIDVMLKLSTKYRATDIDSAMLYAEEAIKISKKIKDNKSSSKGFKRLGQAYAKLGKYRLAIENYEVAMSYSNMVNDHDEVANIQRRIGICYSKQSDFVKAIEQYDLAYQYATENQDTSLLASVSNNLGVVYSSIGEYQKAIEYYFKSIEWRKAMGQEEKVAAYLNNIGIIYKKIGEYEKALENYKEAYDIHKETGKKEGMTGALMNIGIVYKNLEQPQKALRNYLAALELAEETEDIEDLGKVYHNLGSFFNQQGNYSRAIKHYKKSLSFKRKSNNKKGRALTLRDLAETYRKAGKYELALEQAEEAFALNSEINKLDGLMKDYQELALIHQALENYEEALDFHILYTNQKDSVFNQEKANQILRLEAEYSNQQKENELLTKENELLVQQSELTKQKKQVSRLSSFLLGGAFLSLLIISAVLYSRFLIQKDSNKALSDANTKLEKQNTELEQFAFIASHDLKEPTRQIGSFVSLINRRYGHELSDEVKDYFGYIQNSSKRMYNLVTGLYEYLTFQKNGLHLEKVDVNQVVEEIIEEINQQADVIDFDLEMSTLPIISANKFQLGQVFKNLINNGLKYQKDGVKPMIQIDYKADNNEQLHLFSVKDNGIGIKEEYQERIFEIFKRLHNTEKYEGTGIGLSICKRIIDGLDGKIWVESDGETGTTFHFSLPKT